MFCEADPEPIDKDCPACVDKLEGWARIFRARAEELHDALGAMLESYAMAVGDCPSTKTPLPPMAVDVLKGFFLDARRCNQIYHKAVAL